MDIPLQQIINGLTLGSVYAIVALGYTMVYGIIQLNQLRARRGVVMIGAWSPISTIVMLTGANTGLPPIVIVLAGLLAAIPVLRGGAATRWSAWPTGRCAARRASRP